MILFVLRLEYNNRFTTTYFDYILDCVLNLNIISLHMIMKRNVMKNNQDIGVGLL